MGGVMQHKSMMKTVAIGSFFAIGALTISITVAVSKGDSISSSHLQAQTWRNHVQTVAKTGGSRNLLANSGSEHIFMYPKDYPFPAEYYNGFAYRVLGASGESYVIYKQGLSAPPLPHEYVGTQYEIAPKAIDEAIRSGQAIVISQSLSAGTFNSFDQPKGNRFFGSDDTVCYLGACLQSSTLTAPQKKQILLSGSAISAQP